MPIDPKALLAALRPQVKTLQADLLVRAEDPGVDVGLRKAHQAERDAQRTGEGFAPWRRERCTQIAVAWILSVVFVRTLEDRGFLPQRRIAGPGADDSQRQFVALAPFLTTREYLLTVFRELSNLPGAKEVFDARHNPVWVLGPSSVAVDQLLAVFRPAKGAVDVLPFVFDGEDTRFLGDLYQSLSDDVRERYALLQTPDFIEKFILEQTLDPAIRQFGLEKVKLIDPTCGSGHFLLGAFRRLFSAWGEKEPTADRQVLAQRAIEQVYGADINPYAVAIARFRLVLDFMTVARIRALPQCPPIRLNLCAADSLLHGVKDEQVRLSQVTFDDYRAWGDELFQLEDANETLRILTMRYQAVVGNPPYITEKDRTKREKYRTLYTSASGKYALGAPFTERFFGLACAGGYVGIINSNAWTKRDYGQHLIGEVLPKVNVSKVVDCSGAYIPGHGTPTLLLFGRNQAPSPDPVIAVLGKRGEQEEPLIAATAPVWSEIAANHGNIGFEGHRISVETIPRSEMARHPWVLAGGGARRLLRSLESGRPCLENIADSIGVVAFTLEDDVFIHPAACHTRWSIERKYSRPILEGDRIKDWDATVSDSALFPYNPDFTAIDEGNQKVLKQMWPHRSVVANNKLFGGKTKVQSGYKWFEFGRLTSNKLSTPLSIPFALVTTHFRALLIRDGTLFKHSAPIIKLHPWFDEAAHLALLGHLNSSLTAFWCRLVMFLKGGDQVGDGARVSPAPWDRHLEYAGNLLQKLPVPDLDAARSVLLPLVERIEDVVTEMQRHTARSAVPAVLQGTVQSTAELRTGQSRAIAEHQRLRALLVSLQEEIDWRVYGLFGLPTLTADSVDAVVVPVLPEHRPFEVRLARDVDSDISARLWFERHRRPIPSDVGGPLVDLYRRRLRLIDSDKNLQLLETPETKRRWQTVDYEGEFATAWRSWLLDRIESLLEGQDRPTAWTARALAVELGRDPRVTAVAELLQEGGSIDSLVSDLVQKQAVPYLAAMRYTETGMERRAEWEKTWAIQRKEDAGDKVKIDVPDEYTTKDFRSDYWSHRGKLDVPKERFVLYLDGGPESDETPLVGWAGWNHLQRAQALAALYQARKTEDGWDADRLVALLAGLHELVPWVLQWHNEPDEATGLQLGTFFQEYVGAQAHELGKSLHDLEAWRPAKATRGRKAAAPKASAVDPATLLAAVAERQGTDGVEVSALVEALASSAPKVKEVIKTLVETGQLRYTSKRPQRLALGSP